MNYDLKKELIKEAIKEYQKESILEEKRKKKSRVFHNTELLMKHYTELKQHADNAVFKIARHKMGIVDEFTGDSWDDSGFEEYEGIYIGAILKSKLRTTIMVQHIEMALDMLESNASVNGYKDKYDVLIDVYINSKSYDELAEHYFCNSMTIRRWEKDILTRLSVLLFGEEGLIAGA